MNLQFCYLLQALCPKGAISTFARIVKVAIPRITSNGDIILTKTKKQFKVDWECFSFLEFHGLVDGEFQDFT